QYDLGRGRPVVLAYQDGRVVGVEHERTLVRALLADAEVVRDRAAVVRAADPLVVRAELEPGRLGRLLHRVEGGEEGGGVDTVAHRVAGLGVGHVGGAHLGTFPWCGLMGDSCALLRRLPAGGRPGPAMKLAPPLRSRWRRSAASGAR